MFQAIISPQTWWADWNHQQIVIVASSWLFILLYLYVSLLNPFKTHTQTRTLHFITRCTPAELYDIQWRKINDSPAHLKPSAYSQYFPIRNQIFTCTWTNFYDILQPPPQKKMVLKSSDRRTHQNRTCCKKIPHQNSVDISFPTKIL